jgi:hypothetical protein
MAFQINYNDPRYQKAALEVGALEHGAAGGKNVHGLMSDITSRFTQNQMGNMLSFRRIQTAKNQHADRLNFAKRKLAFQKKLFNKGMDQEEDALNFTTIFGLGTGLYSALEGQRRRKLTSAATLKNREHRERLFEENKRFHDMLDSRIGGSL